MKGRRTARRLALESLYQAEIRNESPLDSWARSRAIAEEQVVPDEEESRVGSEYGETLVREVDARRIEIDGLISEHAERWALERMPVIDRCLARIATAELLVGSVPVAVVVNEAVELAKELSTDDSPRYLNGLLGRLADVIAQAADPGAEDSLR